MSLLSTRGRYAVRIMIYMTVHSKDEPIRKADIAASEGISEDYVEQILLRLKQQGFVDSIRGARGGFVMKTPPEPLTVASVVEAVEGAFMVADCKGDLCERGADCVTRKVWQDASRAVAEVLQAARISQLAEEARARAAETMITYEI